MATWGASADRIAVANDVSLDALLERTSQSVRIPSADGAAKEPRALDRFESVVIQSMATPAPAEASTSAATEAVTDFNVDVAFYTGGLVWCVAFCPERRAMAESGSPAAATPLAAKTELLAVALHPKGQTRNIMGAMHKVRVYGDKLVSS